MKETLQEFIDKHIANYNGVKLYISCKDVSDSFEPMELLNGEEWIELLDKKVESWSFAFGTFHIDLED